MMEPIFIEPDLNQPIFDVLKAAKEAGNLVESTQRFPDNQKGIMTQITYPQSSDIIVAFVRTENKHYIVRMVVNKGLSYMYFVDEMGDTWGKHAGYVMLADILSDIGKLEAQTIKESELGVNAR